MIILILACVKKKMENCVVPASKTGEEVLEFVIMFRNVIDNVVLRGEIMPTELFIQRYASVERYARYLENEWVFTGPSIFGRR